MAHYTVEQMQTDGVWITQYEYPKSSEAQAVFNNFVNAFPAVDFRVVENPSRKIVVAHFGSMEKI